MKNQTVGLRYVGAGAYIVGVPARDLSPEEAALHADAIRRVADAGQILYAPLSPSAARAKDAGGEVASKEE